MSNNTLKKIDIIKDLSKKTGYPLNYSKKIINDLVETIIQSIKLGQLNLKNILQRKNIMKILKLIFQKVMRQKILML